MSQQQTGAPAPSHGLMGSLKSATHQLGQKMGLSQSSAGTPQQGQMMQTGQPFQQGIAPGSGVGGVPLQQQGFQPGYSFTPAQSAGLPTTEMGKVGMMPQQQGTSMYPSSVPSQGMAGGYPSQTTTSTTGGYPSRTSGAGYPSLGSGGVSTGRTRGNHFGVFPEVNMAGVRRVPKVASRPTTTRLPDADGSMPMKVYYLRGSPEGVRFSRYLLFRAEALNQLFFKQAGAALGGGVSSLSFPRAIHLKVQVEGSNMVGFSDAIPLPLQRAGAPIQLPPLKLVATLPLEERSPQILNIELLEAPEARAGDTNPIAATALQDLLGLSQAQGGSGVALGGGRVLASAKIDISRLGDGHRSQVPAPGFVLSGAGVQQGHLLAVMQVVDRIQGSWNAPQPAMQDISGLAAGGGAAGSRGGVLEEPLVPIKAGLGTRLWQFQPDEASLYLIK